ncbi:hypothetical protein VTL71DRAFT_7738 [Oculimacula yallundae]|uniref:Uncharacterized protein n=1 Tax=Oculimacula yallundae TaxID=86028 RepID=A0ABR4CVR9_9HELO
MAKNIQNALASSTQEAQAAITESQGTVTGITETAAKNLQDGIDSIQSALNTAKPVTLDEIKAALTETQNTLNDSATCAVTEIKAAIEDSQGTVNTTTNLAISELTAALRRTQDFLSSAATSTTSDIKAAIVQSQGTVSAEIFDAARNTKEALGESQKTLLESISTTKSAIQGSITQTQSTVTDATTPAVDIIKTAIKDFQDTISSAVSSTGSDIQGAITQSQGTVTAAITSHANVIGDAQDMLLNSVFLTKKAVETSRTDTLSAVTAISKLVDGLPTYKEFTTTIEYADEGIRGAILSFQNTMMVAGDLESHFTNVVYDIDTSNKHLVNHLRAFWTENRVASLIVKVIGELDQKILSRVNSYMNFHLPLLQKIIAEQRATFRKELKSRLNKSDRRHKKMDDASLDHIQTMLDSLESKSGTILAAIQVSLDTSSTNIEHRAQNRLTSLCDYTKKRSDGLENIFTTSSFLSWIRYLACHRSMISSNSSTMYIRRFTTCRISSSPSVKSISPARYRWVYKNSIGYWKWNLTMRIKTSSLPIGKLLLRSETHKLLTCTEVVNIPLKLKSRKWFVYQ